MGRLSHAAITESLFCFHSSKELILDLEQRYECIFNQVRTKTELQITVEYYHWIDLPLRRRGSSAGVFATGMPNRTKLSNLDSAEPYFPYTIAPA